MNLATRTEDLSFLEPRCLQSLAKAGFRTVGDVLGHFPHRHEDRRAFDRFPHDAVGEALCLHGVVADLQFKRMGYHRGFVELKMSDAEGDAWSQPLTVRFFHMPYLMKSFAVDQHVVLFGRVKASGKRLVMDHPEFEVVADDPQESMIHLQRIVPIYRDREGMPQRTLRRAIFSILQHLPLDGAPDLLRRPSDKGEFAGWNRRRALQQIHFPDTPQALETARRYLSLEEFFVLQLNVLQRRRKWNDLTAPQRCGKGALLQNWLASLSFSPTAAQLRVIGEIRTDMQGARPMHRLLQGDVGSGKTLVAMAAMLLAVEAGCQAALMAPTQILADQHYQNFRKWLEPLGIRVGLRTGAKKEDAFLQLWAGSDAPQIIVGTHALIAEGASFDNLGLAVIDEQHKFGVEQRAKLINRGAAPHVLVMTATPIPRTLTMTVYGDLDVSVLDEMPPGRGAVHTAVREQPDMAQVVAFLRQQVESGRQAYLVYPLVEESDALKLKAATREHEAWQKRLHPIPVGLVHGRLSAEEKEEQMRRFREGKTQVLVATSVIEVGVDVANATVMIVFEAERFGLAQLHQLRGRIGRGAHRSWCILVASGKNRDAINRLKVLESTTDGFAVAEADLRLRGPGDLLGTAQSGLPGLRLGDLVRDEKLVRVAQQLAQEIVSADPALELPQHRLLRPLMMSDDKASALS